MKSDMGRPWEDVSSRQVLEGREGTEGRTMILVRIKQGGRHRINLNREPIAGGTPDLICDEYIQPKLQPSRIYRGLPSVWRRGIMSVAYAIRESRYCNV